MKHISSTIILMSLALWACSCEDSDTKLPLKAEFESDKTSVLVGDEVSFNDLSTGEPTRWNWTFEGAEIDTSILTQPVVRWMKAGTYTVSLTVGRNNDVDEVVKSGLITVGYHSTITADFTIDKKMAFDNEAVTFTNTSTGYPEKVKWTFTSDQGDNVVSEEMNPSIVFEPGVYSAKLEISTPVASDTKEVPEAFTIIDRFAVISSFTAENRTTYAGGSVKFHDTSTGNVQFKQWTFEGGNPSSSTEDNPVVTYASEGTYKVSLKTWNEEYEDVSSEDNYVYVIPGEGMVFLLPFDGNLNDYGPNGINPSVYSQSKNDVTLEFAYSEGRSGHGSSLVFPKGSAKGGPYCVLQMPDKELSDNYAQGSDLTVSAWTKLSNVSANQALFAQGDCPGVATGNNQIWSRYQANHQFRCTGEKTGVSGTGGSVTVKSAEFDNGEWHHIAIVYTTTNDSKRSLAVYLDGKKLGSALSAGKDTKTIPYFIGCNVRLTSGAWAPENIFMGEMDDFALYKRGLSEDELNAIASMR